MVTTPPRQASTPLPADITGSRPALGRAPPRVGNRRLFLVGLVVLLAGLIAYGLRPGRGDKLADLETATVQQGDIEETVTALGKLEPRDYVDVGAQVSGQLTRIAVQPGAPVKQGDLLAEIDPQIPAARVEADKAELARLTADLADARARSDYAAGEFRRQTRLKHDDATRDDTFEQARRDMRSAAAKLDAVQAQIVQAESTLEADRVQLGYTRIDAPMAGTVVSVDARQGQTINAAYATPVLMRVADLATMTVWTQVSEADIPQLHPGMPLYFTTLGFGDRRWAGTLRQILPAPPKPDNQNGTTNNTGATPPGQPAAGNVVLYTALFDIANPKGELRPAMTAQVFFVTAAARDVPTVPMSALTPKDAGSGRYTAQIVKGGQVATRDVHIGVHTRFAAQVLSGLSPGDTVVTGRKTGSRPSLIELRW
ncbi:MAG TPA: efflux RND transporter periplasmic adaptor subunit [Stellaceae bacterium]|nr:efflux RND transporter periplasmic adaptor subunit [Stellaceae bacterium]